MKILAIETSCDETAIAVLEIKGPARDPKFEVLSNVVLSQIKLHKPFGGVVPNLAKREHQKNLPFILKKALREAGFSISNPQFTISKQITNFKLKTTNNKLQTILKREPELLKKFKKEIVNLSAPDIDAIAVTYGPGLEPALWVGINFARALSYLWKKPLIPVNHLEGHIYASFLQKTGVISNFQFPISKQTKISYPHFPLLALIVSGGHTELVLMKKHLNYKILGETRDDAAGEVFDKVARMLGLPYPGGPEISRLAFDGSSTSIRFPRPMINSKDFDFSFSGLKTSVLYYLRDNFKNNEILSNKNLSGRAPSGTRMRVGAPRVFEGGLSASGPEGVRTEFFSEKILQNIAASFEQAVIDVLVKKTGKALEKYKVKSLIVGGGVAANKKLRTSIEKLISEKFSKVSLFLSPLWLTGDNASMIAAAAYFRALKKKFANPKKIKAEGNLRLD